MILDFRDVNQNSRNNIIENLEKYIYEVCENRNLTYNLKETQKTSPVKMNSEIINKMKKIATEVNIPYKSMPSWAAHDAMIMNEISKIGMIFVRSKNGLSHCPEEFSTREDLTEGTKLLYSLLLNYAN